VALLVHRAVLKVSTCQTLIHHSHRDSVPLHVLGQRSTYLVLVSEIKKAMAGVSIKHLGRLTRARSRRAPSELWPESCNPNPGPISPGAIKQTKPRQLKLCTRNPASVRSF